MYYFKFCPFNKKTKENLKMLCENKIRASSFDELNDPFEIEKTRRLYSKYHEKQDGLEEFIRRYKRRGVYCLYGSEDIDFPLSVDSSAMWSHYADDQKGFCIVFSDDLRWVNDSEAQLMEVQYQNDLPEILIQNQYGIVADKILLELISIKGTGWRNEKEWRIVFKRNKEFFGIPTGTVKCIICGCYMTEKDKNMLTGYAKKLSCELKMIRLSSVKFGYEYI